VNWRSSRFRRTGEAGGGVAGAHHREACAGLAGTGALGVDTASIDYGRSQDFRVHRSARRPAVVPCAPFARAAGTRSARNRRGRRTSTVRNPLIASKEFMLDFATRRNRNSLHQRAVREGEARMPDHDHSIATEAELRSVIGEPMEFVRAKICAQLNEAMQEFVRRSPVLFVATIDEAGNPDVSPKGDPAGFVELSPEGDLLIPERPGNRLTFGFKNILRNGRIGLIFVVPNQLETLRVKGKASLHRDPEVLARMQVSGKPALLYTRVRIEECFFHCGKALVRSHLWQPETWGDERHSIAARQFTKNKAPDQQTVEKTEAALQHSYRHELY
jgi:uncharacterized protein